MSSNDLERIKSLYPEWTYIILEKLKEKSLHDWNFLMYCETEAEAYELIDKWETERFNQDTCFMVAKISFKKLEIKELTNQRLITMTNLNKYLIYAYYNERMVFYATLYNHWKIPEFSIHIDHGTLYLGTFNIASGYYKNGKHINYVANLIENLKGRNAIKLIGAGAPQARCTPEQLTNWGVRQIYSNYKDTSINDFQDPLIATNNRIVTI